MAALKVVLTILFVAVCLALAVIVLLQEGKANGLGAISGAADTYWGKNKGRSMEGKLEKGTKLLVIAFFVFAILLDVPAISGSKSANASNNNNAVPIATQIPASNDQNATPDASGSAVKDNSDVTSGGSVQAE